MLSFTSFSQGVNQGVVQSTQYPVNMYLINSAYAGCEEYTSLQTGFKKNWVGLENSPQTFYLSGHTRLQKEKKFEQKPMESLPDPGYTVPLRGRSANAYLQQQSQMDDSVKKARKKYEEDYKKEIEEQKEKFKYRPYHGIGANVISEQTSPTSRLGASLTYAFHMYLTKTLRWSLGVSGGISQTAYNLNDVHFAQPENNLSLSDSKINPDISAGTFLYTNKFHFGFSAFSLIPYESFTRFGNKGTNQVKTTFMGNLGYKISLSQDFYITPSLWGRYSYGIFGVDFNVRANYKNVWGGITYRRIDALAFMVGINLNKSIDLSYAYDYTLSPLKATSTGGHELILGYRLKKKKGSTQSLVF